MKWKMSEGRRHSLERWKDCSNTVAVSFIFSYLWISARSFSRVEEFQKNIVNMNITIIPLFSVFRQY